MKKIKRLLTSNRQVSPEREKKKKKTFNFLNKFKVKLLVAECYISNIRTGCSLPTLFQGLAVSQWCLSCSQLCLSKSIPGEPQAWQLSAHTSAVS